MTNSALTSRDENESYAPAGAQKRSNVRWWLAGLFFVIGLVAYMDRANISIVAVPMMEDLGIDKLQFGLLASLFTLGYAVSQIPGGMLAERFGARKVVAIALTLWSVFTIATAMASQFVWMAIVRFIFGVGEGPLFPANASFNSRWYQASEKGRAASALLAGSFFGPVIAPIVGVMIFQALGWHAVFWSFGVVGLLLAVLWWFVGRDTPAQHPWVSVYERNLIAADKAKETKSERVRAPWGKLLRKPSFWALGIGFFAVAYCNTLFLVWLPTYLQEARGLSLTQTGWTVALPWLAIGVVSLLGSAYSDRLVARGKSAMLARGVPAIIGLVIFIVAMLLMLVATSTTMIVLLFTVALGALGLPIPAFWTVATQKGGKFAGSVGGWMNTWGSLGGVVAPLMVGFLAQTVGWNTALVSAVIPIALCVVIWAFFIKPNTQFVDELAGT